MATGSSSPQHPWHHWRHLGHRLTHFGPGLFLTALIAILAYFLGKQWPLVGGPVFGILLGIFISLVYLQRPMAEKVHVRCHPGILIASKQLLQVAVVLLGFGLQLQTVLAVGSRSLPVIISTIATALLMSYAMARLLRLDRNTSILVGVGSSICGGSAIAATAPVVEADHDEVAQAIAVVFFYNILAALIFPSLGMALGFSNDGFALFAGTAVNDTSSVTATAAAWDSLHGTAGAVLDQATIVKLTRTLAIIPITLVLSLWKARQQRGKVQVKVSRLFPRFILYFVLASVVTTLVMLAFQHQLLPAGWEASFKHFFHALKQLSKFCIIWAMVAIGLNTDLRKLLKKGGPALLLGGACWIAISLVSILVQKALHIF